MKITITERDGISRELEPITFGIPFKKGVVRDLNHWGFRDEDGRALACGKTTIAQWDDNSVRWGLFDIQVSVDGGGSRRLEFLELQDGPAAAMACHVAGNSADIATGKYDFHIGAGAGHDTLVSVSDGSGVRAVLNRDHIRLRDETGAAWNPVFHAIELVHDSALKKILEISGAIPLTDGSLDLILQFSFFHGKPWLKTDITVRNPKPALHPGGAWDLGDENSVCFKSVDLSVTLDSQIPGAQFFQTALSTPFEVVDPGASLVIYQNSSGLENWQSQNHVDGQGGLAARFRGYKVFRDNETTNQGLQASPTAGIQGQGGNLFLAPRLFWQNFPKSLGLESNRICLGLFPEQSKDLFELQPGEQKRHAFYWGLDPADGPSCPVGPRPLVPVLPADAYFTAISCPKPLPPGHVPGEVPYRRYEALANEFIHGEDALSAKNENADEFGWRNFGDVYADHEAVFNTNGEFISHYNNQYDLAKGCLFRFMSTGDAVWFDAARHMADHVADIDIYHTHGDKAQFNQGMFWHTDHHLSAATATHRTISVAHRDQKPEGAFGGGPAPDHNYAGGFLYLYYMTGETRYRDAVLSLAGNISACMDAPETLSELLFQALRGIVKKLLGRQGQYEDVFRFDGPGRASGNSLNTLMDAWLLTREAGFLDRAELLISTCVSPDDDPMAMDLPNAELRWMYTIFLQALGRYLGIKAEMGQVDDAYAYAAEVLCHYARWMAENEYPYLEKPDILEFPTETWAAQELRKSDVFAYAAHYAGGKEKERFRERAKFFFDHAVRSLDRFDTKTFTRPMAILLTSGLVHLALSGKGPKPGNPGRALKKSPNKWVRNLLKFSPSKELSWIRLQLRARRTP